MDPALALLANASLSLLFGAAALHKLRHAHELAGVVAAYELTSEPLSVAIARVLPGFELGVAVGIWLPATRVAAAVLATSLLAIYAAAIAINLARGRRHIDCGCSFSGRGRTLIGGWMLARNGAVISLAAAAAVPIAHRTLTPTDALTVVGGLCVLTLLYLAIDGLHRTELQS